MIEARWRLALTPAVLVRIVADAVMVNLAFLLALLGHSLFVVLSSPPTGMGGGMAAFLRLWLGSHAAFAWLLTLLCLVAFSFSGFYTFGRAYRGRYKAVLVFQAVSVAYLLFAFALLTVRSFVGISTSVLLASWLLTLVFVGSLRVGSAMWRRATWAEARIWGKPTVRRVRNVTVVGGAGYIGSVLTRDLLNAQYNVTVLDSLMYGDASLRDLYSFSGFDLIEGDIRNVEAVVRALRYADAVVHLGGLVGDPACALDEQLTLDINLHATRMVAEVARGFGVGRFIFASSCSVYGASDEFLDERSALNPVSLYARTKVDSGDILLSLAADKFSPTLLRFGTVFGMSPRPRFDLVVNLLTAQAVVDGQIAIHGGNQWRPFVHVADVSRAIVSCLEAETDLVNCEVFNVGSDEENYTLAQIAEEIERLVPGVKVEYLDASSDPRNYRVSFVKLREKLGYEKRFSVADGVREIRTAIDSGAIADYEERTFNNLRWLAEEGATFMGEQNGLYNGR